MTTTIDLVEEVLSELNSNYYSYSPPIAQLLGHNTEADPEEPPNYIAMSASHTSINISGPTVNGKLVFNTGVWEIGTEIILVQSFDNTTGLATNIIRGYAGTTPTSHAVGTPITYRPKYSRIKILEALNYTLNQLPPFIVAVDTTEIVLSGTRRMYDLPSDAVGIMSAQIRRNNTSPQWTWEDLNYYEFDITAGSGSITGKAIKLKYVYSNARIQVTYFRNPTALTFSNNLEDTGLPIDVRELLVVGAVSKLLRNQDLNKDEPLVADQEANSSSKYQLGYNNSRWYLQQFNLLRQEAAVRFKSQYTPQWHKGIK